MRKIEVYHTVIISTGAFTLTLSNNCPPQPLLERVHPVLCVRPPLKLQQFTTTIMYTSKNGCHSNSLCMLARGNYVCTGMSQETYHTGVVLILYTIHGMEQRHLQSLEAVPDTLPLGLSPHSARLIWHLSPHYGLGLIERWLHFSTF